MVNHKGQGHTFKRGQGQLPQHPKRIHIEDALIDSGKHRGWTPDSLKHDLEYCGYFIKWLSPQGLLYWDELDLETMEAYLASLEQKGLARQTVRHYLNPLKRTSKWIAAKHPKEFHDICSGLRHPKERLQLSGQPRNPTLTVHEVLDFLEWLEEHPTWNKLSTGIALQGLAGLSMQEALRLNWDDVNLKKGIITVQGRVKNQYRFRTIPVVGVIIWLLRKRPDSSTPVETYSDYRHYSTAVRKALLKRNSVTFQPKNLRNTIQTFAMERGFHDDYLLRYVGHAPRTISGKHYVAEPSVDLFQKKIVVLLEAEIAKWPRRDSSRIIPGPRAISNTT